MIPYLCFSFINFSKKKEKEKKKQWTPVCDSTQVRGLKRQTRVSSLRAVGNKRGLKSSKLWKKTMLVCRLCRSVHSITNKRSPVGSLESTNLVADDLSKHFTSTTDHAALIRDRENLLVFLLQTFRAGLCPCTTVKMCNHKPVSQSGPESET